MEVARMVWPGRKGPRSRHLGRLSEICNGGCDGVSYASALRGIIKSRRRRPVTIEEMTQAAAEGAATGTRPDSPRRTSTDMRALSLSRMAPARWCALHFSARMAQQVHLRAGKT
jgi:hypothetical protein